MKALLAASVLGLGACLLAPTIVPAQAQEWRREEWRDREHAREEAARERDWREHERRAAEWRRAHEYDPAYVYAPPAVVYAPPPPASFSLTVPFDIR